MTARVHTYYGNLTKQCKSSLFICCTTDVFWMEFPPFSELQDKQLPLVKAIKAPEWSSKAITTIAVTMVTKQTDKMCKTFYQNLELLQPSCQLI